MSFHALEQKLIREGHSVQSAKRIAAAAGFKNLGKAEMQRRAKAGRKHGKK